MAYAAQHNPVADARALVTAGNARFTVLTPTLLRLEWSPTGTFEDRPSLVFLNRRLPVPAYDTGRSAGWLTIRTEHLTLRYRDGSGGFGDGDLSIEFSIGQKPVVWRPGLPGGGNLGGTVRTLDNVDGACPLEPGLLSREGWTLVDDSARLVFDESDPPWPQPRAAQDALDWYFFGYARDYLRGLHDFTLLAGRIPLPPRFVFGAWWSRYWAYTDQELKELVAEFRQHDVPLDVLVLDMDWHLDGWSGYTWNPRYFPDPPGFLRWAHEQGLKVPLNIHPGFEIEAHEQRYADFAEASGHSARDARPIPYDLTDRRFARAYFDHLLRPREREGVDFWWLDMPGEWSRSNIAGLDALWWLNHLHWTDAEGNPARKDRRPLIFSRWGGLGNHRYQLGFSGDTHSTWASLAFQPHLTATAGNVCFPYWSHDVGGHQPGPVDAELYLRWIQWAVFSPVLRTHATQNAAAERRIWTLPDEMASAARNAFHLRYELLPYIYTAARQCYDSALPLCRPLYYEWPELDEAYQHPGEYLFGDALLVAPVTVPADPTTRCARRRVWLPPGQWMRWFTGETYRGPGETALDVPLDEIPVFVRAGAIIPAAPRMSRTHARPLDPLILHVFPGDYGEFLLYEDDGESLGYQRGECARTPIAQRRVGGARHVTVGPSAGAYPGMPARRACETRLRGTPPPRRVTLNGSPLPPLLAEQWHAADGAAPPGWFHDATAGTLFIRTPAISVTDRVEVAVVP